MIQDYRELTVEQHDLLEKQTLRTIVQAMQEYSKEAKQLFDTTPAPTDKEEIVLAEDIVQYALEVAECYPINRRFAGTIDYKRVRWCSTAFGVLPQAFLVDAKASTEANRDTLQNSQLPMDAEFRSKSGHVKKMVAGFPAHLDVPANGGVLHAVTTSAFIHFYYKKVKFPVPDGPLRDLKSIFVLCVPHARLKGIYNPDPDTTFFGEGKHSPARNEVPRIRVYFNRLRDICPWRLQELRYTSGSDYATPLWRDVVIGEGGERNESNNPFLFVGR